MRISWRSTGLGVAALGGLAAAALVAGGVAPVGAATATFSVGVGQSYTVPAGVTAIDIDASGASGGFTGAADRGLEARVVATVCVTPGEVLTIDVGGEGGGVTNVDTEPGQGGVNGGGNGGEGGTGSTGAGGGGATVVARGATSIIVAGGGGGGAGGNDPGSR